MESIEDFFKNYFAARTGILRSTAEVWEPHVKHFFAAEYNPWQRDAMVRESEQEKVLSVREQDESCEIIITGAVGRWRMRYRTVRDNQSWRIASIEMECFCKGSGKRKDGTTPCPLCKGAGWKLIGQT